MPEKRSAEMQLVGYALARCGLDDPPPWLGAKTWNEAYDLFFPSLGGSRSASTFRNSLKNARDAFDGHVPSARTGWVDHKAGGKPYRQDNMVASVLAKWQHVSEDQLRDAVLGLLKPAKKSSPSGNKPWPAPIASDWTAIEGLTKVRKARSDWRSKFAAHTEAIGSFHGPVLWDQHEAFWAAFLPDSASDGRSHMTFLGVQQHDFRANTIVEINVPFGGANKNIQGAFAVDNKGHRWVLHQGWLHPGVRRVSPDEFAEVKGAANLRVPVVFSDGTKRYYFRVADLDAPASAMHAQMGAFVLLCERVRLRYAYGEPAADAAAEVDRQERGLFPENSADFSIPEREAKKGSRTHAKVFNELVASLQGHGIKVANERIGRFGPDLYTACKMPKLFEIKTSASAGQVQQGVGQLFLYEKVLGVPHRKILVLPKPPTSKLAECLNQLSIEVLSFTRRKGIFEFAAGDLKALCG